MTNQTEDKLLIEIRNWRSPINPDKIFSENQVSFVKQAICKARQSERQSAQKEIDKAGLEDVIDFLNNLKNLRIDKQEGLNYEDGELPFGTCDYMAIDDMVSKLSKLKSATKNDEKTKQKPIKIGLT